MKKTQILNILLLSSTILGFAVVLKKLPDFKIESIMSLSTSILFGSLYLYLKNKST